jgi:hypothetical protein
MTAQLCRPEVMKELKHIEIFQGSCKVDWDAIHNNQKQSIDTNYKYKAADELVYALVSRLIKIAEPQIIKTLESITYSYSLCFMTENMLIELAHRCYDQGRLHSYGNTIFKEV